MSMYPIATYTVTSPVTPITFTSIPQTFAHLHIRLYGQSGSGNSGIRFNGDAGNNYSYHYINGNGSGGAATSGGTATTGNGYLSLFMASSGSYFGAAIADILDYTNTSKYKTMRTNGGADLNGSGNVFMTSTLWQSTAAITSFSLIPDTAATFAVGTRVDLYGIGTSNATGA